MNDKYTINSEGRVVALKDFGDVKTGDIGGFVDTFANLSAYGDAWIYGNARVYGNAQVYENARVAGNAQVYENARVAGDARVYGDASVKYGTLKKDAIFISYHPYNIQHLGNTFVKIGCQEMCIEEWLQDINVIAKRFKAKKLVSEYIHLLQAMYIRMKRERIIKKV
jgi:hypothetical protein